MDGVQSKLLLTSSLSYASERTHLVILIKIRFILNEKQKSKLES